MYKRWGVEIFTQGEYDDFQRLANRFILGQTLRFNAFQGNLNSLSLGFGGFHEWEEIQNSNANQMSSDIENLRGNIYVSFHWDIKDRDTFFFTLYYQPFKVNDFRVLLSAGYQIPLGQYFSLSLEVNYNYDSKPPHGIEKMDVRYFTTLNYTY